MAEKASKPSSAFFLFGPAFATETARLASKLADGASLDAINGLYTGLEKPSEAMKAELGSKQGEIWNLKELELDWLSREPTAAAVNTLQNDYPPGTIGRLIVADRRIGRGFIRNAFVRPDPVEARIRNSKPDLASNYVINLMSWAEGILRTTNPEFLFLYAIAGSPALALALVAERLTIPYLTLKHSRISNLYFLDHDFRGKSGAVYEQMALNASRSGHKNLANDAEKLVARFRKLPERPDYALAKTFRPRAICEQFFRVLRRGLLAALGGYHWWLFRRELFELRVGLTGLARSFRLSETAELTCGKFVYFPLHVDPEASTMVLSPHQTDQLTVVEAISKALPPGYSVVVKDHSPMLGRRPRDFYRKLRRLPRVHLVDMRLDSFALIRKSEAVITITGTVGQEALFLGKPVVALGESPYINVGSGVFDATGSSIDLAATLQLALKSNGAHERDLLSYLTALLEISFPLQSGFLWGQELGVDYGVSRHTLAHKILQQVSDAS